MNNEYVEELYSKFSKDIAKNELNALKHSLEACDNSKYEILKNFVPEKKNPLKSFNGLCVFIAMLVGGLFLVVNAVLCGLLLPASAVEGYEVFTMIMLVLNCILASILLCYFAVYIPIHAIEASKHNIQAINNIIDN